MFLCVYVRSTQLLTGYGRLVSPSRVRSCGLSFGDAYMYMMPIRLSVTFQLVATLHFLSRFFLDFVVKLVLLWSQRNFT